MPSQIPNIAFYCVACGSFDVQIRPKAALNSSSQAWCHPNIGVGHFNPDTDDLEGRCLNCRSNDWDAIESGNDWWNDFREWFAEQPN
jgi:hypothetical protein